MKVWVVAETAEVAKELVNGAKGIGASEVTAFVGGDGAGVPAAKVYALPVKADSMWEAYACPICEKAAAEKPAVVLVADTKRAKIIAASIAAKLDAPCVAGCKELKVDGGTVTASRMIYGGMALKTMTTTAPTVVATVAPKTFEPADGAAGAVEELAPGACPVKVTGREAKKSEGVDLSAAAKVVSVGRGFAEQSELKVAEDLAAAIGAAMGCSRPIAEFFHWLPEEQYVGISGQVIKPQLYVACGISGQVQHLGGCRDAKVIVAVNKDENAPMLAMSDYYIIGDVKEVLPALTAALK